MKFSGRPFQTGKEKEPSHRLSRRKFFAVGGCAASAAWLSAALPSTAAQPIWQDRRSFGPFDFQATFDLGGYAPTFREISALELELQRTLAIPPARKPIHVYLFDDKSTHRDFLAQLYPRVPYRRALYVQRGGVGTVYAYQQPQLAVDLRHECTHALLHSYLPMVPLWLDEGLAEYFEMPESQRAFDHPHLSKLRWNLRFGMVRSVESLEDITELKDMGAVEYRFAWAWVHFMLHGPVAAHRALLQYFGAIRRGNPPGKMSTRLRAAVPDLDERMVWHFKHWRR